MRNTSTRKVGQLLDKLDETGLRDNTLVIYSSDHGEMAGEHGCWWKSNYYEGSVGVPLIARLPGVIPAGVENPVLCNLLDWAPTAVEVAGGEPLPAADGHSLWRELQGHADNARPDTTFSELGPLARRSSFAHDPAGTVETLQIPRRHPAGVVQSGGRPRGMERLGQCWCRTLPCGKSCSTNSTPIGIQSR